MMGWGGWGGGQTDQRNDESLRMWRGGGGGAEEVSGSVFYVENVQSENVLPAFCFPFTLAVVELLL